MEIPYGRILEELRKELGILQGCDLGKQTPEQAANIQERITNLKVGIVALQEEMQEEMLSDLNACVWSINHRGEA